MDGDYGAVAQYGDGLEKERSESAGTFFDPDREVRIHTMDEHGEAVDRDVFPDRSLTVQSQKSETDINAIMDRLVAGAPLPQFRMGQYLDVSEVVSFSDAMIQIAQADRDFMSLPAPVRAAFGNSAVKFLEAIGDPAQVGRLRELGLVAKDEPVVAPVALAPVVVPKV